MHTLQQLRSGELAGATKIKLSCGLTTFPPEILALADTLEYLDLSGNFLSSLPDALSRFKKLKIAFFSDNLFTELPAVLGALPKLEMLGFKANKISHIPENSLAPGLRWLILTNNQIEKLPGSIGNCLLMQKLMLAGNKLQTLPATLANCRNLELLRISANEFSQIPAWLFEMPRLAWLAIAGNPACKAGSLPKDLPEISWQSLALDGRLGEGASGEIFKAHYLHKTDSIPDQVAVKIFKGEVTSDGLPANEMDATLAAGSHPNLVKVLGKVCQHPAGKHGLVLELIPADFLNLGNPPNFETCTRDTFPEDKRFSWSALLNIAKGIASAAAHLHKNQIMHGDLYAHNILTNEQAYPLLGDFGAATVYSNLNTDAEKLEKLEIRAFGYLLEDLLDRLEPAQKKTTQNKIIFSLKEACLQETPSNRPDFRSIRNQISLLHKQYQHTEKLPIPKSTNKQST